MRIGRREVAASVALLTVAPRVLGQSETKALTPLPIRIGAATIRLTTPNGYVETSVRAPDVYALALAFSAGDARIVAHYVKANDLALFEQGKKVYFSEFLLAQTPRRAENLEVTQAQFDKLRNGTVALQGQLSSKLEPLLAAEAARLSKAVSGIAGANIKVKTGEMVPISIDRDDAKVISYSVLASTAVTEGRTTETRNMVASTAACFVSRKVIMLNVYRVFRSPRDLQANKELLAAWVTSTLSVN